MAQDLTLRLVLTAADQGYTAALTDAEGKTVDFGDKIKDVRNALLALAGINLGIGLVKDIIAQADAYSTLAGRIKSAVGPTNDYVAATNDVIAIANTARTPLDETAALYEKIARNASNLNLSQKQVADITQIVSESMQLSGASVATASGAITQFGQALGTGVLRGDEFNSVFEASPQIMQAIADGIGVPIGKLRELAEQGKLTADIVTQALLTQKDTIDASFGALPETVGQAITKLGNAFEVFIGQTNQGIGATKLLADGIDFLANNLDSLDTLMAGLAAGGVAKLGQSLYGQVTAFQAARLAASEKATATVAAAQADVEAATSAETAALIQQRLAESARAAATAELAQVAAENSAVAAKEKLSLATVALQQANTESVAATLALESAQNKLITAQTAAASKAGLLTGALNLLGGPAGIIMLVVTGLGLMASAFSSSSKSMEDASKKTDEYKNKLNELNAAKTEFLIQQQQLDITTAEQEKKSTTERIANIESLIEKYKNEGQALEEAAAISGSYFDASESIAQLESELIKARSDSADIIDKLTKKQADLTDSQKHLNDVTATSGQLTLAQRMELEKQAQQADKTATAISAFGKAFDAQLQAQITAAKTTADVTKALGDESAAYQAAAVQAGVAAKASQSQADAKAVAAKASQDYADALGREFASLKTLSDEQQKKLTSAQAAATADQAAAAEAQAMAQAAQLEAAQLAGVAAARLQAGQAATTSKEQVEQLRATYEMLRLEMQNGLASEQAVAEMYNRLLQAEKQLQEQTKATGLERTKTIDELASLRQSYQDSIAKVQELQAAQQQGTVTQAQVNAAIADQVRALAEYKTALEDAIKAADNQSAAVQRGATIAQAEIQVKIDQANAAKAEAEARGNSTAAIQAEISAKELAVQQAAALVSAEQQELVVLQQILVLKQQQAQADGEVTLAEQAEIAALKDSITEKQLAIESEKAHVDQLDAEAASARNAAQAQQDLAGSVKSTSDELRFQTDALSKQIDGTASNITSLNLAIASIDGQTAAAFDTQQISNYNVIIGQIKDRISDAGDLTKILSDDWSNMSQVQLQQALQLASQYSDSLDTVTGTLSEQARIARDELLDALQQVRDAMKSFAEEEQKLLEQDQLALEKLQASGDEQKLNEIDYREKLAELQKELEIAQQQSNQEAIDAIQQRIQLLQQEYEIRAQNLDAETKATEQVTARTAATDAIKELNDTDLSKLDGALQGIINKLLQIADTAKTAKSNVESMTADSLVNQLNQEAARA